MRLVHLKELAKISAGQGAPKNTSDFSDEGIPFVRAGSLDRLLKGEEERSLELVPESTAKKYRLKLYPAGSVLFAKSGMSATKDRVYCLKNPAYVVSHLAIVVSNNDVNSSFLTYALRRFKPSSLIRDNAYPSINLPAIENHKVFIPYENDKPDLNEQIRIATLISRIEALIATRKKNLQQLDEFLKSTFLEMFGNPVRNEKGWEKKALGDIFEVKHGFAFKSQFFTESGYYVLLTPGNFYETGGYRDRADKQKYYVGDIPDGYILDKEDLLIAMTEQAPGLLGSPILIPESNKYLHNQRLGRLVLKLPDANRQYLFHLFNTVSIRQVIHAKATGIKVRHTSPSKIEAIQIGYPDIKLQNRFGEISTKIELLKKYYELNLTNLKNFYAVLSQKAFKGELDLSRLPLPESATKEYEVTLTEQLPVTDDAIRIVEYPMSIPAERTKLLRNLFDEFLTQHRGGNLSLDDFWQQASFKTIDMMDEFDKPWGADDYDKVKDWLFELIREEKLEQDFVLSTDSPPDGQIELKIKD